MNKKIFLLGSAGYIGSQILNELCKKNNYLSFDKKKSESKNYIQLDISSKRFLKYLKFYKPKIIINCATNSALSYKNNLKKSINQDIDSILNILKYLVKNPSCKLIYFSSSYVYSGEIKKICFEHDNLKPTHNFGIAKVFFENLIQKYHHNSVIFRLSSVFGKGKALFPNAIYNFIKEYKKDNKITVWGSGKRKMQYIYMEDVVKNTLKSFNLKPGVYNLGGDDYISIKELSKIISNFYNTEIIFKKKKEGETLPFMSTKKIQKSNKIKFSRIEVSLLEYLKKIN